MLNASGRLDFDSIMSKLEWTELEPLSVLHWNDNTLIYLIHNITNRTKRARENLKLS